MNLTTRRIAAACACLATLALLQGCESTSTSPIDEASVNEGLEHVKTNKVDALYRRPGASLSGYSKLLMKPTEVQFAKNWDPKSSSSIIYEMNEPDREKIKTELAEVFAAEFKKDMEKGGGIPIVTSSGSDVLEMRSAIVNLYITAPDVSMQTPGRTRVYTADAGEMTLIMQLHDSVTGQLLARVYDRRQATQGGMWTWTNSVTNTAEARRIIGIWATSLRKAFDAAHSPDSPS